MILLALALAAAAPHGQVQLHRLDHVPRHRLLAEWYLTWDAYWNREISDAAGLKRLERLTTLICGPEGSNDATDTGPTCERDGWNGRRYVPFCEGRKAMPRRNDPWIRHYIRQGNSRRDARIELSDNRTNACD